MKSTPPHFLSKQKSTYSFLFNLKQFLRQSSIIIKFNNGIRGQEGNSIIDSMTIQCGSNIATMKEISVMMGSGSSQKNITGYVSQKLVDYLKPFICKETQETPTKPSDF